MDIISKIFSSVADIYYGLWANMLSWTIFQRAAMVIFLAIALFAILIWIVSWLLGKFLQKFGKGIIKFIFGIWQRMIPASRGGEKNNEYIQRMNQATEKFSILDGKIQNIGYKLTKYHGPKIRYYLIAYFICIMAVGFPEMLRGKVNESYLDRFAFGQTIYCSLESGAIEKAKGYDPLLVKDEEESLENSESEEDGAHSDGLWLRLSEKGIQGSYLRSGPGAECDSIKVLSGEVQMRYIDESGKWIYVETQDGILGWIHRKLVEAIE